MNQTAQHLARHGRNGDTMLVHMSPKEVGGLQALARSNGGTLTINPHTGLPEAFSLGRLLPMAAGAALTAFSGGTLSPLTIGLMTGGIGALATGSLKEGLLMGLGAAGGAGLAGSFANLAAPSVAAAAAPEGAMLGAPGVMGGAGSGLTVPAAAVNTAGTTSLVNSAALPQVGLTASPNAMTLPSLTNAGTTSASVVAPSAASSPLVDTRFATVTNPQLAVDRGAMNLANQSFGTGVQINPVTQSTVSGMTLDPSVYGRPFDPNITRVFTEGQVLPNAYTVGDPTLSTNYPLSQAKLMAQSSQPVLGGSAFQSMPNPAGGVSTVSGPIDATEAGRLRLANITPAAEPMGTFGGLKAPPQIIEPTSLNTPTPYYERMMEGAGKAFSSPSAAGEFLSNNKMNLAMSTSPAIFEEKKYDQPESDSYIRPYSLDVENTSDAPVSRSGTEERRVRYRYTAQEPYKAAEGGIVAFARGGQNRQDPEGMMLPDAGRFDPTMQPIALPRLDQQTPMQYAEGGQTRGRKKIDRMDDPYTFAAYQSGRGLYDAAIRNFAQGGLGGQPRFLSGGGDGMSDSIPATINGNQPARLADGEFVVPADVVSHLGNGSSKAGADQLYGMMDRIRKKRTGKKRQAPAVNPKRLMPA